MNTYVIYLLAIVGSVLVRRGIRQLATCQYVAKEIANASELEDAEVIKGIVNSLTDPKENKWFFIGVGLVLFSVIYIWYQNGFFVALGFVAIAFLMTSVIGIIFFSKPDQPRYVADIVKSLHRRNKEFEGEDDVLRADAIKFYIQRVESKFRWAQDFKP